MSDDSDVVKQKFKKFRAIKSRNCTWITKFLLNTSELIIRKKW